MTQRLNFIPSRLVLLKKRARIVRIWTVANIGLATILGVSIGSVQLAGMTFNASIEDQITGLTKEVAEMEEVLPPLRERVTDARRRVSVADQLRARPDWSVVLQMFDSLRDGGVTLESVHIRPERRDTDPDRSGPIVVSVSGIARDSMAVLGYASRVQRIGIFDDLPAPKAVQRSGAGRTIIGFEMTGRIAPGEQRAGVVQP